MALDKDTVAKVANLARIRVSDERAESLVGELNQIIGWVEQLEAVDTEGVEPMTSVVDMKAPRRPDDVTDGGYPERVLANGPQTELGFYVVPKVVE